MPGCCVNITSLRPGLLKDVRAFEADLKSLSEAVESVGIIIITIYSNSRD